MTIASICKLKKIETFIKKRKKAERRSKNPFVAIVLDWLIVQ